MSAGGRPACRLCDRPAHAMGLCHTHGERWRRWGKPPLDAWIEAFLGNRLNTCEVCGKQWNGYHNRRTCSAECDRERRRRVALARYHAYDEVTKQLHKRRSTAHAQAKRDAAKVEVRCVICGAAFVGWAGRKFCSRECRSKDVSIRRTEIRLRVRLAEFSKLGQILAERLERTDHDQEK